MLSRTDLRGTTPTAAQLRRALPRGGTDVNAVLPTVTPVIEDVKAHGASAALDYGERFDKVRPTSVRVPAQVIADAAASLIPRSPRLCANRSPVPGGACRPASGDRDHAGIPGGQVAEKWVPVRRVGLYVPGGNAVYPSSVVMNVVPAQAAGGAVAGRRVTASSRLRRLAAPDDPRRLCAAGRRRGVGRRWRAGRRPAGLRR